ncbi:TPA: hypothetical protein OGU99_000626 [Escherichia coli]|nr:hypothetical protein [Escherichia coli]
MFNPIELAASHIIGKPAVIIRQEDVNLWIIYVDMKEIERHDDFKSASIAYDMALCEYQRD